MEINDWIDKKLDAKDYIQAQEDREDFILTNRSRCNQVQQMDEEGWFVLQ